MHHRTAKSILVFSSCLLAISLIAVTRAVEPIEPYKVRIEKIEDAIQGQHEYVDVTLDAGEGGLGGFEFLVVYDRSALNFQQVVEGDLHDQCDWEYFTYRCWFWPTWEPHPFWAGLVTVVAAAELMNGPCHPSCFLPDTLPAVLFTLDFLVTDNRQYECLFVPVNFFWTDCGDNTLWSRWLDTCFLSQYVYDSEGMTISQEDSLPTYFGAPSECLDDDGTYSPRLIDFYNGGIGIACGEPIDVTGDVNLNGVPYEVADLIVFTCYFLYGEAAFNIDPEIQTQATDMNRDSLPLDVADLVYGIRVLLDETAPDLPYDTTSPFPARFVQDTEAGTVEVITPDTLGVALLGFQGDIWLRQLHPQDMDIRWAWGYDANLTRFLIYSLEGRSFEAGPLISYGGDGVLVEASTATHYGGKVETVIEIKGPVPADFALHQNYPNPFNNGTVILFDLPNASRVEFEIVNVLGEVVYSFHRHYPGGWYQIDWNGTDNSGSPVASGVYYYRIKTAVSSDSKKMILLK